MSISARRARVISVAQTRAATRMLDIVTLTLITITFTLTPPLALLILLFDVPSEHTRVLRNAPADPGTWVQRPPDIEIVPGSSSLGYTGWVQYQLILQW